MRLISDGNWKAHCALPFCTPNLLSEDTELMKRRLEPTILRPAKKTRSRRHNNGRDAHSTDFQNAACPVCQSAVLGRGLDTQSQQVYLLLVFIDEHTNQLNRSWVNKSLVIQPSRVGRLVEKCVWTVTRSRSKRNVMICSLRTSVPVG